MALVEWGDAAEPVLGADALDLALAGTGGRRRRRTGHHRPALGPALDGPVGRPGRGPGPVGGGPVTLLAIESATDLVGVALVRDDGATAERLHAGGRAHAELLIPSVEEVCAVSGCTVADIDVIAVDIGPGLFTGLRVGVATAKALGQALSIGLVGVSSLDILAAAALERAGDRPTGPGARSPVVSVVDARRGEVFAAAYRFDRADGPGDPVDPGSVRDDRTEPITPGCARGLAGGAGPGPRPGRGGRRRGRPVPPAAGPPRPGSTWTARPGWPPRPRRPRPTWPCPGSDGGSRWWPPATWSPTTDARPTPASTGSSGPPRTVPTGGDGAR